MQRCSSILLILILVAAAGCQGNPQLRREVDSYNAEARRLEDMIYLLEQDIQVLEQENSKLRRRIEHGGAPPPASSGSRGGILGPLRRGHETPPGDDGPPKIEMPDEPSPRPKPPAARPLLNKPTLPEEPDTGPALEKPDSRTSAPTEPTPATPRSVPAPDVNPSDLPAPKKRQQQPEVIDRKVTHLHLNPLHTGGADFDRTPGDDGLSVLIEPRNAEDQFVPLAAPVSVVLLDPAKNGDDARIARWDFSQAQAQEKLEAGDARGIHLQLPWPTKIPDNTRLQVFVRYETADGQKLQVEREIFVTLPGQFSERWTPRPVERQRKNRPAETNIAQKNSPPAADAAVKAVPPLAEPETKQPPASPPPAEKAPSLLTPPAGLGDRPAGDKAARPTWAPSR